MTDESKTIAEKVGEYFDRMSATDKKYIQAAIQRVERMLERAGLKPAAIVADKPGS